MKTKYFIFGTALCGVMGLTSCNNEEFLNVDPYNIIEQDKLMDNDEHAKSTLNGVYDMLFPNDTYDGDWGFKPNLFTGCHPTIDTQATGWDKDWNSQNWNASSSELLNGWKHVYAGICRANEFLAALETADKVSPAVKKSLEGEGRAVRGFLYHWLATTFGRVPMLSTGENYINTPEKKRAETYTEMWDFIIEDFKAAAELLDWKPMDGQYGRATKGMALAYLGDSYMWEAYRLTEGANGQTQDEAKAKQLYASAAACFKQILDSKTYKLNESFTTLWDPASAWGPEAIWVEQLDEGTNWGGWGDLTSKLMLKWYTACPENGGWGSLYLSWEWYASYEKGDKRRAGSCYTGAVPQIDPSNAAYDSKYEGWYEPSIYGVNPYLQEVLGHGNPGSATRAFHFTNGEWAPAIWSSKMWRTASAEYKAWGDGHWSPTPIYWKRLPNVMLDYAECLFRTQGGDCAEAWAQIDALRNRAFGKMEDNNETALTSKYLAYYNQFAGWVGRGEDETFKKDRSAYPIPFGSTVETVEDAKTYYTRLHDNGPEWFDAADRKAFKSPVWKVAVNMERRKEFNCEWCLRPDMQKSGFMADHVDVNYPKRNIGTDDTKDANGNVITPAPIKNIPWTNRNYDYNDAKMDMPIPQDELLKNGLCDQNPAYTAEK